MEKVARSVKKLKGPILLKWLGSIPVILLLLYQIPFLGMICLLLRYFIYPKHKLKSIPYLFLILAILLLLPDMVDKLLHLLKIEITMNLNWKEFTSSAIYQNQVIPYAKLLLGIGIIFLLFITFMFKCQSCLSQFLIGYLTTKERQDAEVSRQNDLLQKEKQERAKHTKVLYCPFCGADNLLTEANGVCLYCRRKLSQTEEKR